MTAAASPSRSPLRGVLFYAVAVLLFASLDTLMKLLTTRHGYPVPVVAWARYTVQLLLMTAFVLPSVGRELLRPKKPVPVVVRSLTLVVGTLSMGTALKLMPLAEAEAIVFTAPLLMVLLAGPLLGERITVGRVALSLLGFTGVLLIARPGGQLNMLGVLFALICAVVTAAYQLMSRGLNTEQPLTLLFNSALVGAVAFALMLPFHWHSNWHGEVPTPTTLLMFLALGVAAGLGHFLLTLAFRYAPATVIAPMNYLQLFWAGLLGWQVFHHIPDPLALLGMGIIAAAGIATVMSGRRG